jgi:hypothetical protein
MTLYTFRNPLDNVTDTSDTFYITLDNVSMTIYNSYFLFYTFCNPLFIPTMTILKSPMTNNKRQATH